MKSEIAFKYYDDDGIKIGFKPKIDPKRASMVCDA